MTLPESNEVQAQHEADALWMAEAANDLFRVLEEALDRPSGYQAFIGSLMLRYGLVLTREQA